MTSSTSAYAQLAQELTSVLHPSAPPIAITFSAEAPEGVASYDAPLQEPGPDGRRGRAAAGCVSWMKSIDRTFTTVAEDHSNCSVGCIASRTRTGMPSTELTCAIPARRLGEVIEAIRTTAGIDASIASYASTDALRFA